jgi:hypothetical protein
MPPDESGTLIQSAVAGYPGPEATPARPPHQVLWFAAGLGLWLVDAILAWAFVWFLRHG